MSTEQIQYWGMWATIAMTLVTGWMAWRTAKMAEATNDLAATARNELDFLKEEADRATVANMTALLSQAPINIGVNRSSVEVAAVMQLRNGGPGYADQVCCQAWLAGSDAATRVVRSVTEVGLLRDGESATPQVKLEMGLDSLESAVEFQRRVLKTVTVLITWRDQKGRPWALLQSYESRPGRDGWRCDATWPNTGRGTVVRPDDSVIMADVDPRLQLPELRSRLSAP